MGVHTSGTQCKLTNLAGAVQSLVPNERTVGTNLHDMSCINNLILIVQVGVSLAGNSMHNIKCLATDDCKLE